MTRTSRESQPLIQALSLLSLILPLVHAQCNTDQNPYCRGNDQLEQLCCPYPNVCYWQNRNGDPGCCAAGQVCIDQGGGAVTPLPAPAPAPVYSTLTTQNQPLSTVTSYATHGTTAGGGGVVVVTTPNDPVYGIFSTVTSGAVGVFSTITSDVAGAFSTVTSDIAGAYDTVTSTIGAVATEAASGLVQNINAAPSQLQEGYQILLALSFSAVLWQLV